jgi:hypothetical protein
MDAAAYSLVISNIATATYYIFDTLLGISGAAIALFRFVIKPQREQQARTEVKLAAAQKQLSELADARIAENIAIHAKEIEESKATLATLEKARYQDYAGVGKQISDSITQALAAGEESRRLMHDRLNTLDRGQAALDERTKTTNETIKTIADQVTELVAAVGRLAGRVGA